MIGADTLTRIPDRHGRRPISPRVIAALASVISCRQRASDLREDAAARYGDTGAWIAGGFRDHWPASVKDRIRMAETEASKFLCEARDAWRADRRTRATFRAVCDGLQLGWVWYASLRPEISERYDLRASETRARLDQLIARDQAAATVSGTAGGY